jgi:hypothetical protein
VGGGEGGGGDVGRCQALWVVGMHEGSFYIILRVQHYIYSLPFASILSFLPYHNKAIASPPLHG